MLWILNAISLMVLDSGYSNEYLSMFSTATDNILIFFSQRKLGLTFHVNHLSSRKFT